MDEEFEVFPEDATTYKGNAVVEDYERQIAYLRADFDNYKKQTAKKNVEIVNTANKKLVLDILPIVDDFERHLENLPLNEDTKPFHSGALNIYSKLLSTLSKYGVEEMDCNGKAFDADKHEVISVIHDDNKESNTIASTILKGYTMNNTIIRFPKVIVYK